LPEELTIEFDADGAAWHVGVSDSGPAGAAKLQLPGEADLWVDRADATRLPWLRVYAYEAGGEADPAAIPPIEALYGPDAAEAVRAGREGTVRIHPGSRATLLLVARIALALDLWAGGDRDFAPPAVGRAELAAYAAQADPRLGLRWLVESHLRRGIAALADYDEYDAELLSPDGRAALLELHALVEDLAPEAERGRLRELSEAIRQGAAGAERPLLGVVEGGGSATEPAPVAAGEVIDAERAGRGVVRVRVRTGDDAGLAERALWVRAVLRASGAFLSIAPVHPPPEGGAAEVLLPLPDAFDVADVAFELTAQRVPRAEAGYGGARAAVVRGASASGAERRADWEAALALWGECADGWAAAGDARRADLARGLAARAATALGLEAPAAAPAPVGVPHEPLLSERVALPARPSAVPHPHEHPRFRQLRVRRDLPAELAASGPPIVAGRTFDDDFTFVVDRGAGSGDQDRARIEAGLGRSLTIDLTQLDGPPLKLSTSDEPLPRDGLTSVEVPGRRPLAEELEALLQWVDE
jgi:hypothetical protein